MQFASKQLRDRSWQGAGAVIPWLWLLPKKRSFHQKPRGKWHRSRVWLHRSHSPAQVGALAGRKAGGSCVIKDGKAVFAAFAVQHKIRARLRGWLLAIRLWQLEK